MQLQKIIKQIIKTNILTLFLRSAKSGQNPYFYMNRTGIVSHQENSFLTDQLYHPYDNFDRRNFIENNQTFTNNIVLPNQSNLVGVPNGNNNCPGIAFVPYGRIWTIQAYAPIFNPLVPPPPSCLIYTQHNDIKCFGYGTHNIHSLQQYYNGFNYEAGDTSFDFQNATITDDTTQTAEILDQTEDYFNIGSDDYSTNTTSEINNITPDLKSCQKDSDSRKCEIKSFVEQKERLDFIQNTDEYENEVINISCLSINDKVNPCAESDVDTEIKNHPEDEFLESNDNNINLLVENDETENEKFQNKSKDQITSTKNKKSKPKNQKKKKGKQNIKKQKCKGQRG